MWQPLEKINDKDTKIREGGERKGIITKEKREERRRGGGNMGDGRKEI